MKKINKEKFKNKLIELGVETFGIPILTFMSCLVTAVLIVSFIHVNELKFILDYLTQLGEIYLYFAVACMSVVVYHGLLIIIVGLFKYAIIQEKEKEKEKEEIIFKDINGTMWKWVGKDKNEK